VALKGAFSAFLMLNQAESKTQSTEVNDCMHECIMPVMQWPVMI